jgi:5-methylcytosine-specific restriction protein A
MAAGNAREANVVDHVVPHRGNYDLFWDEGNWQSLCEECHNTKTAAEDGGFGREPAAISAAKGG